MGAVWLEKQLLRVNEPRDKIALSANWKTMKLPDLVQWLYKIVKLQVADCKRALYGHGNCELAPWMFRGKTQYVNWGQKSEHEKEELYQSFKKDSSQIQ